MDIHATLNYLYSLNTRGIKLGLERVSAFLTDIGSPQKAFKSVHIAGTNGKGTISHLTASVLRSAGFRTGLYTSPHILRFNERITVNGIEIRDEEICAFTEKYKALFDKYQLTFFEITTGLAFDHFKSQKADYVVAETGMGGRLDATNVLIPAVSAIGDISMDHEAFLGNTIRAIASEKAGIIKKGVPLVFGMENEAARDVVLKTAGKLTEYRDVIAGSEYQIVEETAADTTFNVKTEKAVYENLYLTIPGRHLLHNALIALGIIEALDAGITEEQVREGFKQMQIRGRLQYVKGSPDLVFDVSHNPRKISALNDYLTRFFPRKKIVVVFGVMADKDWETMARTLVKEKREFLWTRPDTERALDAQVLAAKMGAGTAVPKVTDAFAMAREKAGKRGLVVVTGSFFTVSEAMAAIGMTV